MSTNSRSYHDRRDPPKRKKRTSHDTFEEAAPARKKQHRKAAKSFEDDEIQFEDYGSGGEPTFSRKSKAQSAPRKEHEYPSVNELKKRIRDVKRLLNKVDLPADVRIVQERALAGYEQDLAEEIARRQRSQMIKKYHFVRFLGKSANPQPLVAMLIGTDRKTATKELNRLLRREEEKGKNLDSSQKAQLAQKIKNARVNLNYTIYYPLTEKYMSIYPKDKDEAHAESEPEPSKQENKGTKDVKPPLWSVVASCMENGTLDQLREGKLNINANGEKIQTSSSVGASALPKTTDKKHKKAREQESNADTAAQKAKHVSRGDNEGEKPPRRERASGRRQYEAQMNKPQDENEDSDGGFFEE